MLFNSSSPLFFKLKNTVYKDSGHDSAPGRISTDKRQADNVTPLSPTAGELRHIFAEAARELPFHYGSAFKGMLSFTNNLNEPIHRWFNYKEGYSHQLVSKVLERYPPPDRYPAILDPFCGASTTLLVAQSNNREAVGIEINPFAVFLSKVKTSWYKLDANRLEEALKKVLADTGCGDSVVPELTTFHNKDYFPGRNAQNLFKLRDRILCCGTSDTVKNALLVALAATLEDVSCLHKDGRLLRYKKREVLTPKEALKLRAGILIEDICNLTEKPEATASVLKGDGRSLEMVLAKKNGYCPKKYGLVLYSPPYLNNFDYSEVYKCELWLLGFIRSYEQWRRLRRSTFRSHPSCKFNKTSYLKDARSFSRIHLLVEQTARCTNIGGKAQKTAPDIIRGYFDDIYQSLRGQAAKVASGGHIVCVVGNSRHGRLHIPTDVLIGLIGLALGLQLVEIYVGKLRYGRKEKKHRLRESLVVFRKPE